MADVVNISKEKKEIPSYYSNALSITVGPYDFILSIGYKTPEEARKKEKGGVNNLAEVPVSPSQAKTLLVLLKEMVDYYEKNFGEIPMEDNFKKRYSNLFKGSK